MFKHLDSHRPMTSVIWSIKSENLFLWALFVRIKLEFIIDCIINQRIICISTYARYILGRLYALWLIYLCLKYHLHFTLHRIIMLFAGQFWWSRRCWCWWPFCSSGQSRTWQDGRNSQGFWGQICMLIYLWCYTMFAVVIN